MGYDLKQCNSDLETLSLLRMIYGKNVMCTNGLFHIMDDKHNEVYINRLDGTLDKRGLYNTLVVLDSIIVSKVVNNNKLRFVVLNKNDLSCIYKTKGNIFYIDEDMLCDKYNDKCTIISHTGKYTRQFDDAICINKIYKNFYLLSSTKMFSDKILMYNKHKDYVIDLTDDKRYTIHRIDDKDVEILPMSGNAYIYDFSTRQAYDKFNGGVIDTITLLNQ